MTAPPPATPPMEPAHAPAEKPSIHQVVASWVFGSLLFVFLLGVFAIGPKEMSAPQQKLLALFCSLLAGFFTFFLTGTVEFLPKKLAIRATGGIAVFLIVLYWWGSPVAPIKVRTLTPANVSARMTLELENDPGMRALVGLSDIVRDDATLELRGIRGDSAPASLPVGWIPLHDAFHLKTPSMAVRSSTQSAAEKSSPSTAGIWIASIRTFTGFSGNIGSLADPKNWSNAALEARFTAHVYADLLKTILPDSAARAEYLSESGSANARFNQLYHVDSTEREAWPDYTVRPLPIRAHLQMLVDGQVVGESTGMLVHLWEHDEDTGNTYVIAFPAFRAASHVLDDR